MEHRGAAAGRGLRISLFRQFRRAAGLIWLTATVAGPVAAGQAECPGQGRATEGSALRQTDSADGPSSQQASPSPLVVLYRAEQPSHAVLMLAGIYNDHHYFQPWWGCFTGQATMLLGWQRSHHTERLEASARLLASEMMTLHGQGIRSVTLLAHSIGGLVAKGAVDLLKREQVSDRFASIELHAFGTPWGGFPGADLAHANPLGQLVSYVAGHPAWLDLGTHSAYLAGLAQAMPSNGRLFNYIGEKDEVALPSTDEASQRYARLLDHASVSVRLSGPDHNAYVSHSIDRLMRFAQQRSLQAKLQAAPEELSSGASE